MPSSSADLLGSTSSGAAAWAALAVAIFWASDQAPSARLAESDGRAGYDPVQCWPRAVAAAEKAIALVLRMFILFDWPGARADLERASAR